MFNFITTYANGNAKIIPSTLSKRPPWPGIILPVSLIFDNLLKYEIMISPSWLIVEMNNIKIKKGKLISSYHSLFVKIDGFTDDADNDGVSDAFDKSPNTPLGVAVDGSGNALDVDMDNVPDYRDADPFSNRGAQVDENGVEHLFLVESSSGNRHEHYIKAGTVQNIHNILVGYEAPDNNASINIFDRSLWIK